MRSRAARLTVGAFAWIVLGGAVVFLVHIERQIAERRAAWQRFDELAHDVARALADARVGQQAYLAGGQGATEWMPTVEKLIATTSTGVEQLRQAASGSTARAALMEAGGRIVEFSDVDRRVRQHLKEGQSAMAGDLVFAEGRQAAAAARLVDDARVEEQQAQEALEGSDRRQQVYALAATAAVGLLTIALLVAGPEGRRRDRGADAVAKPHVEAEGASDAIVELPLRNVNQAAGPPAGHQVESGASARRGGMQPSVETVLKAVAEICTGFSRANDLEQLTKHLGGAADLMFARGVIVWIGDATGSDLKPLIAHGYPEQVLAMMPVVPRSADNAAAAAYRTGTLQIVRPRPDGAPGAVVAPLLSPEGCVGALTAEIKADAEISDTVQALAALFAAQLTSILLPTLTASDAPRQRIASA
jgi:hypothetical protein